MLLVALDTAGPNCAVALADQGGAAVEILASATERVERGHAERLMPMIEAVLASSGAAYSDLGRIVVTTGPGSFTGVRVGIAAARALALALDIPAVGIGSLAALASGALQTEARGTAIAALDARRGEVYAQAQDIASGAVLVRAAAMPAEDVAATLRHAERPILLCGSGAPAVAAAFAGRHARVIHAHAAPDIADVALLALRAETSTPPVPLYARGADAKPQLGKAVARA